MLSLAACGGGSENEASNSETSSKEELNSIELLEMVNEKYMM